MFKLAWPLLVRKQQKQKTPLLHFLGVFLLVGLWCFTLGWGMALAINSPVLDTYPSSSLNNKGRESQKLKSSDPVSSRYQVGQETYLENCASCHIPIPPEVLPSESWKEILENPQKHYGAKLPSLIRLSVVLMWDYLRTFSRSLGTDEAVPAFVQQSRYFKALHPNVELPEYITPKTCVGCHPAAEQLNYRLLSPQWEDAP